MKFRNVAYLALLIVVPAFNAHADSSETMAKALNDIARQYELANSEEKETLKVALQEVAEKSDGYLVSIASTGNKPADSLVDATHHVKQLLHS